MNKICWTIGAFPAPSLHTAIVSVSSNNFFFISDILWVSVAFKGQVRDFSYSYLTTNSFVLLNKFFKMSAGCCGVKKQKLNNSLPSVCCNGTSVFPAEPQNGSTVRVDMCFFCFDVLHSHLYKIDPPKTPSFTNDAL